MNRISSGEFLDLLMSTQPGDGSIPSADVRAAAIVRAIQELTGAVHELVEATRNIHHEKQ